jgi:hypothetical protein
MIFLLIWRRVFWKRISVEQDVCERVIISALREKQLCFNELKSVVKCEADKKYARHFPWALEYLINDRVIKQKRLAIQEHPCSIDKCACSALEARVINGSVFVYRLSGEPRKRTKKKLRGNVGIVWGRLLGQPT